jgi:trehalose-6-phosphate synthase
VLGAQIDEDTGEVHFEGRTSRVATFPLGIPVDYFEAIAGSSRTLQKTARIRRGLRSEVVVLGVDRLDYTKGILERLLGFERFLERNPDYHHRVTLVLIAVPSRTKVTEYAALKRQLDEAVGRVVGRFSSDGWVPIRYLYTQFGAEDLIAYYQAADIALLTPLRDGMNLVAKEYVAAQDPDDPGVLILSRFAGAAVECDAALLVNPYDPESVGTAIAQALSMPLDERRARHDALFRVLLANDVKLWGERFLAALTQPAAFPVRLGTMNPSRV